MIYDQYQGLIFDMDGTLLDTETFHTQAWRDALSIHGITNFEDSVILALKGSTALFIATTLLKHVNYDMDPHQLVKEKMAIVDQHILQNTTLLPLIDLVKSYYGKRPMALGTGTNRVLALKLLHHFDLARYFDAVVTSTDIENPKPAPDTFLKCAELLGLPPQKCVVFEDSNFGIQAAQAAGIDVVDIKILDMQKLQSELKL